MKQSSLLTGPDGNLFDTPALGREALAGYCWLIQFYIDDHLQIQLLWQRSYRRFLPSKWI